MSRLTIAALVLVLAGVAGCEMTGTYYTPSGPNGEVVARGPEAAPRTEPLPAASVPGTGGSRVVHYTPPSAPREASAPPATRVFTGHEASFPTGAGGLVRVSATPRSDAARVGQPLEYTLRVTNLSRDLTLEKVVLTQDLPETFESGHAERADGREGRTARWTIGELRPGETRNIDATLIPQEPGEFQSSLRVQYEPVLHTTINVVAPRLVVEVQAPDRAGLCDGIPVRVRVRNAGTGSTDQVSVRLLTPEGLAPIPGETRAEAFDAGQIAAGSHRDFTVRFKPDRPGPYVFSAAATSQGGLEARSDEATTTVWAPRLDLRIDGPETAQTGENAPYTVVITNTGDGPAQAAVLRINLDREARVVQPTTVRVENTVPQIDIGTIPEGERREIPVVLFTREPGPMRIRAEATGRCAEARATSEVVTTFEAVPALLLEAVDEADPVSVGQHGVYRIAVTNQGTGPDTNIHVTATFPDSFEFVSGSGATPPAVEGRTIRFAPLPTLGPREKATWTVTLRALRQDDARFHAEATSDSIPQPAVKIEPTRLRDVAR